MPVFHLDIEAFITTVQRIHQPDLASRPLVVASPLPRALVYASSPDAKQLGIFRDMPLNLVRKQFPDITIVPPDYKLYAKANQQVLAIVHTYSPIVEPIRFGHVAMDMTGMRRLHGSLENAALKLGRELQERLRLNNTVGIAANKLVSTIAAKETQKHKEALYEVPQDEEPRFLAPLTCKALPDWNEAAVRKTLFELNLRRIEQIQKIPRDLLSFAIGAQGTQLHRHAMGVDPQPVTPPLNTPCLKTKHQFETDTNDDQILSATLFRLTEELCFSLRAKQLTTSKARVHLSYTDDVTRTRSYRFQATQKESAIHKDIMRSFHRLCDRRQRVRHMTLTLEGLNGTHLQAALFGPSGETRLLTQLDQLRKRFGAGAVLQGKGLKHTA